MSTPVDKKKDMEGETRPLRSSSHESKKSPLDTISILVVDDDTTCLSIVAAILKRFKSEVVTAKHPNDALCTLRIKGGAFDLVVSDVHMPDMNGFELQKAISKEFNLPVVLMSADDKEGNVLKGMENGAAFFLVKPVCEDDLKDLWQFAAMKKKSQVVIEETGSSPVLEKTSTHKKNPGDQLTISASSVNEDKPNNPKKDSKRKSPKKEGSAEEKGENSESSSTKKPKIIWTNSLHNRFLEAIRSIGLDRAVPKKILEIMNVPGLTRENVASHLQKYRIFLRRVSDASSNVQYSSDKGLLSKSIIRPSIASSSITTSTPMLNGINKFQYQNPKHFPSLEPSSSNLVTQLGSGQSRLLCNKGSLLKPNTENTDLVHQNPRSFLGITHNNYLEDLSRALSVSFDGSTSKNPGIDYEVSSHINNAINANPNPNPSPLIPSKNLTVQTNYVGFRMSNLKELIGGLGTVDKQKGFSSCNSTTNLPTYAPANNRVECETIMTNENINVDQVNQNLGASSSFVPENINGGDQLSDILADYQMMLPSNVSMFSAVEIGGEINESDFSPLFDLPGSFDIMTNQQGLDEADVNTSFGDQVNMKTQGQINGVETITGSGFFGGTTDWDNNVPSFDPPNQQDWSDLIDSQEFGSSSQLINNTILLPSNEQQNGVGFTNPLPFGTTSQLINTTPQSPTVPDDDDFLESLLAPFSDDQTLEGI